MTFLHPLPSLAASFVPASGKLLLPLTLPSAIPSLIIVTTTAEVPSDVTFEPQMDAYALGGFVSVFILSIAAVYVWATQVVPVSRTNLAISKKSGPVKDYLDELRSGGINKDDLSLNITATAGPSDGRDFERWLFTDWLEKPETKSGRQKEPALPILKQAKWNSGDNPVLVATALISAGVVLTSVVERVLALLG